MSKIIYRNGPVVVLSRNQHGEFQVKHGRSIYYTDDKEDATNTADDMARREEAKKNAPALALGAALNNFVVEDQEEQQREDALVEIEQQSRKIEAKRRARSFLRTSARFMRVKERQ